MFESKEDSVVSETELKELLGCGRGVLKNFWRMGLRYIQIHDSKESRFYLGSDIVSFFKSLSKQADAMPLERVDKVGSHAYRKVELPEE